MSKSQQRNVVLHPEFVDGKYALYTRPQDGFIDAGSGGGIGWALVDDIAHAKVGADQKIIDARLYHTIKEVKNGEGPAPIKTPKGWLHLAHGVRGTASGLRYVLYMFVTALDDPSRVIAAPGGAVLVPWGGERRGDSANVLFANGWIADPDGRVLLYYASSDIRLHVAESSVDRLLDWCFHTPPDRGRTAFSVEDRLALIRRNRALGAERRFPWDKEGVADNARLDIVRQHARDKPAGSVVEVHMYRYSSASRVYGSHRSQAIDSIRVIQVGPLAEEPHRTGVSNWDVKRVCRGFFKGQKAH